MIPNETIPVQKCKRNVQSAKIALCSPRKWKNYKNCPEVEELVKEIIDMIKELRAIRTGGNKPVKKEVKK